MTDRKPTIPKQIAFYSDQTLTDPAFGGTYAEDILHLAVQLFDRPLLLDAVLYRELYSSLLPTIVRRVPESGDLGLLCAYQFLSKKEKTRFLRLWQVVSPRQFFGDIVYNAPFSFPLFNRVTQGTFLQRILPFLDELEPAITPLTTREYIQLLETFMMNYASSLNEQELRVLHLIQENPTATLQQLHDLSDLSIGRLSK